MTPHSAAAGAASRPAVSTAAAEKTGEVDGRCRRNGMGGVAAAVVTAPVVPLPVRRSFPLVTQLVAGEGVDSWVEALASRYETTTGVILDALEG